MEAFFVSAAVVAVAEIGDKTQLLALMLAARYRKPVPIILGILWPPGEPRARRLGRRRGGSAGSGADTMRWILGAPSSSWPAGA